MGTTLASLGFFLIPLVIALYFVILVLVPKWSMQAIFGHKTNILLILASIILGSLLQTVFYGITAVAMLGGAQGSSGQLPSVGDVGAVFGSLSANMMDPMFLLMSSLVLILGSAITPFVLKFVALSDHFKRISFWKWYLCAVLIPGAVIMLCAFAAGFFVFSAYA